MTVISLEDIGHLERGETLVALKPKTVWTLNIGNYFPEMRELTYPLLKQYAKKIGAGFLEITERKFPDWPVTYEKLQLYELGRGSEWNCYLDADTLVNPNMFDLTPHLGRDMVCHNGKDMAGVRWRYDQYFKRDGRHFGSCNWCTTASNWCLDVWRPLDDITLEQALDNIYPTVAELNSGYCRKDHLIDDYVVSRNIARFGLKATTVVDICASVGWSDAGRPFSPYLYHVYNISNEEKLSRMLAVLSTPERQIIPNQKNPNDAPLGVGWGMMQPEEAEELRKKWGL